jgi:hypothetical protein
MKTLATKLMILVVIISMSLGIGAGSVIAEYGESYDETMPDPGGAYGLSGTEVEDQAATQESMGEQDSSNDSDEGNVSDVAPGDYSVPIYDDNGTMIGYETYNAAGELIETALFVDDDCDSGTDAGEFRQITRPIGTQGAYSVSLFSGDLCTRITCFEADGTIYADTEFVYNSAGDLIDVIEWAVNDNGPYGQSVPDIGPDDIPPTYDEALALLDEDCGSSGDENAEDAVTFSDEDCRSPGDVFVGDYTVPIYDGNGVMIGYRLYNVAGDLIDEVYFDDDCESSAEEGFFNESGERFDTIEEAMESCESGVDESCEPGPDPMEDCTDPEDDGGYSESIDPGIIIDPDDLCDSSLDGYRDVMYYPGPEDVEPPDDRPEEYGHWEIWRVDGYDPDMADVDPGNAYCVVWMWISEVGPMDDCTDPTDDGQCDSDNDDEIIIDPDDYDPNCDSNPELPV